MVTDGDVSPRGDVIVIRTYQRILAYARPAGGTLEAALAAAPCAIPGPDERQGEAVAISRDSRAVFTTSEGEDPKIYRLEIAG